MNSTSLRNELTSLIANDLVGPAAGPSEEVNESRLSDRYLLGVLAPARRPVDPVEESDEESDGDAIATGDETPDQPGRTAAPVLLPSSLGLTCSVLPEAPSVIVEVRWGEYTKGPSAEIETDTGRPKSLWVRTPREFVSNPISLREGSISEWMPHADRPDIFVKGVIRKLDGSWIVSLFLVNNQVEPETLREEAWLFQAELSVRSSDGKPIFCKRLTGKNGILSSDPELRTLAMLYRNRVEFAVGHGVATHAEGVPNDPTLALSVKTTALPSHEVARVEPPSPEDIPALKGLCVDMAKLSELPREELALSLEPLAQAYEAWIEERRKEIASPAARLTEFAREAEASLKKCEATLKRVWEGIQILVKDDQASEAFRFMNRAMWQQRVRSIWAEGKRRGSNQTFEEVDVPRNRSWRPFQLAFVLINLAEIRYPNHPRRSIKEEALVDLLFFPTGGGKTEAYLGLTAFTLAIRRLQGRVEGFNGEDGVGVLMRYTLRLLTLQQFQRAAALICAMEVIRRTALSSGDRKWGEAPFRLGLWVGMKTTPNTYKQSKEVLAGRVGFQGHSAGVGSPLQLSYCPWCGSEIVKDKHTRGDDDLRRTLIWCGDSLGRCDFTNAKAPTEGLPVVTVDEELYRYPPSLLISTVDKFAQMPWQGGVQNLFGIVDRKCERHGYRFADDNDSDSHPKKGTLTGAKTVACSRLRPPDLIIQDELHLISGPLGSLVGLYETAVDKLCTWTYQGESVSPKIIASTATIRAAEEQVRAIYDRQVAVFPPHGTDVADNFFSKEKPTSEAPGRLYLGLCAKGRTFKAAMKRAYVIALAGAQTLYEKYGEAADPWMTTIGYFNSIKELAGMNRLLADAIRSMLKRSDERGLARRGIDPARKFQELTSSRVSATDIPKILDALEIPFPPPGQKPEPGRYPLDFLLATNMISVGVDVKRLGLMVVCGQPKTTAEYIQATSRVGRTHPGLVLTVYNWSKPRDLSHFEHFEHYHSTFYQHVEATSVTPFASRALDRGLPALLVSLIRLSDPAFSADAAAMSSVHDAEAVESAKKTIMDRAEALARDPARVAELREQMNSKIDSWRAAVSRSGAQGSLTYAGSHPLLKDAGTGAPSDFTCLNSMRNVEPSVLLLFQDDGMEQAPPRRVGGHA